MSRRLKLKNNDYWDTKSIMHNRKVLADIIYPVGSIYMSVNSTNPSTYYGGTWVAWGAGRVPVGINTADADFKTVEQTGGVKIHDLRALIGAYDSNTGKIGYEASGAVGRSYAIGVGGATSETQIAASRINHSTVVWDATTSSSPTTVQPYIVCYMWKRTK